MPPKETFNGELSIKFYCSTSPIVLKSLPDYATDEG